MLEVVSKVSVVSKDLSVKDTPPRELGDPDLGDDLPRPDEVEASISARAILASLVSAIVFLLLTRFRRRFPL